ncbi:MAG: hypothetical protein RL322_1530 [Pseudomonadota bacterium]|jgi:pimeloyl-ACP methyl ester carboxylesterase
MKPSVNTTPAQSTPPTHRAPSVVVTHRIMTASVRIACEDHPGPEPTIVFVHPNRTTPRVWDHVIAASRRSERVLTPALRGHGTSDWPEVGYTIEDHLHDLLAVIDALCPGPVVLCGQATGATLALMAAHRLGPSRIRAVIAAQPATAIPPAINDLVQRQVATQTRFADRDAARAALPFVRFWTPEVIEHHLDHMLVGDDEGGWTWRYHAQGVSATEAQLLRTLDEQMIWAGPTLIIGGQDSTVLPHASIEAIAARLPHAELRWLPRSDHRLSQDNPDGFARLLDDFLEQVLA